MKRIGILILLLCSIGSAQVTSLSTVFKFARWNAGNKLNAGTIGDTSQANASLNYNFDRADAIFGRQMNGKGLFTTLYGDSSADLNIGLYNSNHTRRLKFYDSIYAYYNAQFEQNVLVQGNLYVGGYISGDSILLGSGVIVADNIYPSGNLVIGGYLSVDTAYIGGGGVPGVLNIAGIGAFADDATIKYSGDAAVTLTIPELTDTIATLGGNQNFTDVGRFVADSVQTDNNYTVLYSDTKVAGSSAGDTSANFTTFINTTNGNETKVRFTYLHRRGTQNLKAYYQIKGTDVTSVGTKLNVYTLAGVLVATASNTSTATSTYEEDSNALPVSTLTSNQLYEVRLIGYGSAVTDIPTIKTLTIVATSN